jgi:glutamine amidotransferase
LVLTPPHALRTQSYAPRFQDVGKINADGWGIGWYDRAVRPEPARYRTATPMWADQRFGDMAPLLRSDLVVAAARNASPGSPVEQTGNSPFVAGRYLFTHNGFIEGFRQGLGVVLRRRLSEARDAAILGAADSEVLFGLILDRLDKGEPMTRAITDVLADLAELTSGRYNLLLADGDTLVATRDGNSLFTLPPGPSADPATPEGPPLGRIIASEPFDGDPRWVEIPDRSLVVTDRLGELTITPL